MRTNHYSDLSLFTSVVMKQISMSKKRLPFYGERAKGTDQGSNPKSVSLL